MADNLQKRPSKGILKNSSSFDKQESQQPSAKKAKETKWDEMNIIATLHPPGKDYGHMKIAEPKTPYNYVNPDNIDGLDAAELAEKIRIESEKPPKAMVEEGAEDSDSEEDELTEEEKERKKEFELKRKKHYNEFYALQLAKKLMEEDEDEEEDDEDKDKEVRKDDNEETCSANRSIK